MKRLGLVLYRCNLRDFSGIRRTEKILTPRVTEVYEDKIGGGGRMRRFM